MYLNAVVGEGKCVLLREVSLFQGCPLERFRCYVCVSFPTGWGLAVRVAACTEDL